MFHFNYATVIDPLLKDMRSCVDEISGIYRGDKVLDVCCGTGDQVFHYEQRGAVVIGVDIDLNMLELAEKNAAKHVLSDCVFILTSADSLPFEDGYFDLASASLCLHEMAWKKRIGAVAEMKRVVKKDGTLLLVDFHVPLPGNIIGYLIAVVESLAGKNNNRCFRDYIARGGLHGICKESGLAPDKQALLKNGTIQIIRAVNV